MINYNVSSIVTRETKNNNNTHLNIHELAMHFFSSIFDGVKFDVNVNTAYILDDIIIIREMIPSGIYRHIININLSISDT